MSAPYRRGAAAIRGAFEAAHRHGSRAVIPYICAGDPTLDATVDITEALVAGGADIVEWGIPYSDPLADGVTIQQAAQRALQSGTTAGGVLQAVRRLRERGCRVPLILMVYVNVVLRYGSEAFVRDAAQAGADGLILPDVPVEEGEDFAALCREAGLALIPLVAPTTTPKRLARIVARGTGFVYCISVTGVTGARATLAPDLPSFLERVRTATPMPVAVGFGVSTPEHARTLAPSVDGIIVGSSLIERLQRCGSPARRLEEAKAFAAQMKQAVTVG